MDTAFSSAKSGPIPVRSPGEAALIVGFTIQGLAIARALSKNSIKVYALERRGQSAALRSRHATLFHAENLIDEHLVDALKACRKQIPERHVVLYAASDNTVATVAKYWDELEGSFLLSWSNCRKEIARIIQKGLLPEYCDPTQTRYPKTALVRNDDDVDVLASGFKHSLLIKPNKPASSFKAHIATDADHFRQFVSTERANWPLVVQEWIDGPDSNLYFYSCFLDKGREIYGIAGRKVRASPPGLGRATVIQTLEDAGVTSAAKQLLAAFKISGPASLEFKKDADGNYWFIEANVGRTEFCIDVAVQAGFNVPYMEFEYTLGRSPQIPEHLRHSIWFDTVKEPFCYIALCVRMHTLRPFRKALVFPFLGHEEPRLLAFATLDSIRSIASRALRRAGRLTSLRPARKTSLARAE